MDDIEMDTLVDDLVDEAVHCLKTLNYPVDDIKFRTRIVDGDRKDPLVVLTCQLKEEVDDCPYALPDIRYQMGGDIEGWNVSVYHWGVVGRSGVYKSMILAMKEALDELSFREEQRIIEAENMQEAIDHQKMNYINSERTPDEW